MGTPREDDDVVNVTRDTLDKDTVVPTLLRFEGALCAFTIPESLRLYTRPHMDASLQKVTH